MTETPAPRPGPLRLDLVLEPVAGRAIPVRMGEILTLTQLGDGQRVEFNCFNLHDHKERMSVGHMRREAFHMGAGRMIWSNSPRYQPMMKITAMPDSCCSDLLVAGCWHGGLDRLYGLTDHPNCQDTMADAIAEFGLMPDDTHDPLNFWLNTEWDHIGAYLVPNTGRAGDKVEIVALMDVLAVPATCGAANLSYSGNFSYKPVTVQVFEANAGTLAWAEREWKENCALKTQRSLDDYRVKTIRGDRELVADPTYAPDFVNFPIEWKDIEVCFTSAEIQRIWTYRGRLGATDEAVIRTMFFHWYTEHRKKHGLRRYSPKQLHE
ncbi:DUF1989 domain-containing protein [Pseudorhodoplanes sp.]|uniref:DUF1989 domain-containing protein n=1 Tax=Pseudorhodoplanes sp. TaxID=1934341 RepID=UPI003D108453